MQSVIACSIALLGTHLVSADPQPIDPAELATIRASLHAYTSRISSLSATYTEQKLRTLKQYEREKPVPKNAAEALVLERSARAKKPTKVIRTFDIFEAPPASRLKIIEERHYADGEVKRFPSERYVTKEGLTSIHKDTNSAVIRGPSSDAPTATLLNAIGCRIDGSWNTSLADLLTAPASVTRLDREVIDGIKVEVLRVGPPIPSEFRPRGWGENRWVVMWLAIDLGYLPRRWTIYQKDGASEIVAMQYDNRDLTPVPDQKRPGESMLIPKTVSRSNDYGESEWRITAVAVNPPVAADTFRPVIPQDFSVTKDGKDLPRRAPPRAQAVPRESAVAVVDPKQLLQGLDSVRAPEETNWWPIVSGAFAVATVGCLVGLFAWRRRST